MFVYTRTQGLQYGDPLVVWCLFISDACVFVRSFFLTYFVRLNHCYRYALVNKRTRTPQSFMECNDGMWVFSHSVSPSLALSSCFSVSFSPSRYLSLSLSLSLYFSPSQTHTLTQRHIVDGCVQQVCFVFHITVKPPTAFHSPESNTTPSPHHPLITREMEKP